MLSLSAVSAHVSLQTVTSNQNFSHVTVRLDIYPTELNISGRRQTGTCKDGVEWRLARVGDPDSAICSCPPNSICSGPSSCSISPLSGDVWYAKEISVNLCSSTLTPTAAVATTVATTTPRPQTSTAPSLPLGSNTTSTSGNNTEPMYVLVVLLLLPVMIGIGVYFKCQSTQKSDHLVPASGEIVYVRSRSPSPTTVTMPSGSNSRPAQSSRQPSPEPELNTAEMFRVSPAQGRLDNIHPMEPWDFYGVPRATPSATAASLSESVAPSTTADAASTPNTKLYVF
jgi:hypothetical protein